MRTQVTIVRGGLTELYRRFVSEYKKTCLDLSSGFRDRANRRTRFRSIFGCSHFPPIEYCLSTLIVDHFCQILLKISIHIHSGDLKICHLNEKIPVEYFKKLTCIRKWYENLSGLKNTWRSWFEIWKTRTRTTVDISCATMQALTLQTRENVPDFSSAFYNIRLLVILYHFMIILESFQGHKIRTILI